MTGRDGVQPRPRPEALRVLQLIPSLEKGGAERLVLDACRELGQRPDVLVRLVTLSEANAYPSLTAEIDWRVAPGRFAPSVRGKGVRNLDRLRAEMLAFRPHVVHSHLFAAEMASREIRYAGPAYFTHGHNEMPELAGASWTMLRSKRRLTNYYERLWLLRRYRELGNHFLAVSRMVQRFFESVLPGDLRRVTLLPNAVSLERFRFSGERHPSGTVWRLVSVGSLLPNKNHVFLVEVVAELVRRARPVVLTLLGEGPCRGPITERARALGVSERVRLSGAVENVEQELKDQHLYVHAARRESFGLTLIEAMAGGLPVVCLDGGGNAELMEEGRNGFLLPEPDVAAFAGRVECALTDEPYYQALASGARRGAEAFDMRTYAGRLLAIYEDAVGRAQERDRDAG